MNRLRSQYVYLCGAIDRCPESGTVWRNSIIPTLKDFGLIVLNPLVKPFDVGLENDDSRSTRKEMKSEGKFKEFSELMKIIRHVDLRCVDKSDFLIVYLDLEIFACGTIEEIVVASQQKKPILLVCKQGVSLVPDWLFAIIKVEMMFNNTEELIMYLRYVNESEVVEHHDRWLFFNYNKLIV